MVIKMVMRMVTEMVMWACVALGTYDSLSPSVKRVPSIPFSFLSGASPRLSFSRRSSFLDFPQ